jgi:hypothetical protein
MSLAKHGKLYFILASTYFSPLAWYNSSLNRGWFGYDPDSILIVLEVLSKVCAFLAHLAFRPCELLSSLFVHGKLYFILASTYFSPLAILASVWKIWFPTLSNGQLKFHPPFFLFLAWRPSWLFDFVVILRLFCFCWLNTCIRVCSIEHYEKGTSTSHYCLPLI